MDDLRGSLALNYIMKNLAGIVVADDDVGYVSVLLNPGMRKRCWS
jgi:hypothetical protein